MHKLTSQNFTKNLLSISIISVSIALTGCTTSRLLETDKTYTNTYQAKKILIEDQVVAFGKPATALPNMPANSVVIVGDKQSYVLSKGGGQFVNLLSNLDAKGIHVDKELAFKSAKNDGYFAGTLSLSYVKLKSDLTLADKRFVLENNAKECSSRSDKEMSAQRFCFEIPIQGAVFPAVSNMNLVKSQFNSLTRPYSVSIYTTETKTQTKHSRSGKNPVEKLVLLPFALAFDVVTFPLRIFD